MKYLLDTSVIVDLMRKKNKQVFMHLSDVGIDECCIASETIFELFAGAYSHKGDKESEIKKVESLVANITVLSTFDSMREAGKQKAVLEKSGNSIEDIDVIIASTAKFNNLILVTSNEKHQGRIMELTTENWRI